MGGGDRRELQGRRRGGRAAYAVMAEQASRRGQVSGLAHGRGNHGLARGERAGVILNTGSLAGLIPAPRMAPYTSTKWAVVGSRKRSAPRRPPPGSRSMCCARAMSIRS
ncbi:hypothetical protein BN13_1850003 [Nostocoides jenkinsii Ben 74]|uniref:Uncharacterized protein n=1 Tax=Nostocoides jenkinsii Ben 74 TaxID=1193518 RepID=A0A077MCT6_9MICO|nr:hypothetical protein BN13_1850003 [Tetrasphaera jenkinsii Ben 74]